MKASKTKLEIATGVGAQSAGVVLSKVMKLKLSNDEWSKYFKEVKDTRRAFRRLDIPAEQLEAVLWNAIFMIVSRGQHYPAD
jgi:hypothetical protein